MKAYDALKAAASREGVSLSQIGERMGKPRNYVVNGAGRGSVPKADTLADMLAVCGWSLVATPKGTEPPESLRIDGREGE